MPKYRRDYYRIDVPSDIDVKDEREGIAISEARERARLYVTPCVWDILGDDGDIVTVRRTRRVSKRALPA